MGKTGPKKVFGHQMWVQVTDAQMDGLRQEAALAGASVSEIVRSCIDERLRATEAAS